MYKVTLYCEGCKKEVADHDFSKSKIITVEAFEKGPWYHFDNVNTAKCEIKFALCKECYEKYFSYFNSTKDTDKI